MPGRPTRALVSFGGLVFAAAIGRGGKTAFKREGDGATPRGDLKVLGGYRSGSLRAPVISATKLGRAGARDGWCDAPDHAAYNRYVRLPFGASHETLARPDALYDVVLVLDWNVRCRRRGAGSAIFLHLARPGYEPTEGCVALKRRDLMRILPHIRRGGCVRVV
ncbi:L,D-transpeptidase family protein [Hoeflea marina]|nr:L,D-transpeptidase family protein [Hoeflea marina]